MQSLLTVFAETTTGGNRRDMENAKRFLDQQIETYATQLRAAEQRRAEFHEKYLQLLPGADGGVSHLDAGRAAVTRLKLEVEDARAKRDSIRTELDATPKILSVDSNAPQVIVAGNGQPVGARARLAEARAKLEELSSRFTAAHPDMIALRRQISMLEEQARKEPAEASGAADQSSATRKTQIANPVYDKVKLSLVDAEMALASAQRRLGQAEKEQGVLEEKARAMPGVQAQAQDLDRDYAVKKKNFDELLARREQARIAEAADTTADKIQFRVIDPPQVPVVPAAPNQPIMLSGVLVAAIGAAVALPFLLFQFDRSYTTLTALRALGVPVLGSVSHLVSADGQTTRADTACRRLRQHRRAAVRLWSVAGNQRQPVSIELRLMESRIGLIERAAALLRETGQENLAPPVAPATSEARSAPSEARSPLGRRSRHCARASCSTATISREPAS